MIVFSYFLFYIEHIIETKSGIKSKKYHTVGTNQISNIQIVERAKIDIHTTHIHDLALFGTDPLLKVSELLLFNVNSAICQLCHGENYLIFNEMMMRSALF